MMPLTKPNIFLTFLLFIIFVYGGCGFLRDQGKQGSLDGVKEQPLLESQNRNSKRSGLQSGSGGRRNRRGNSSVSKAMTKGFDFEAVKAKYHSWKTLHPAIGKILAPQNQKAIVSYAFPARVSRVHSSIGDWVNKGQILFTLQSEEVGVAKSDYYKTDADLELARSNFERQQRLFDRGVGAKKDLISSDISMKVAVANLEASEKKLHVLGFSEEEVKEIAETHQVNPEIHLFAPISGRVIEHNVMLGAMVDQSTEMLTLMDPSLLWVDAEVFERDLAKVKEGQEVRISVPAFPGETFKGKISYIADIIKDDTRTITVRSKVNNADFRLKPGMFADVSILLNHRNRVLVLPSNAILDDGDEKIVFLKQEEDFVRQVVQTGSHENGFIEILEGLRPGDLVVTSGNYQLKSLLNSEALSHAH